MMVVSPHRLPSSYWWRVRFLATNNGNTAGDGSANYVDIKFISMFTQNGGMNLVPLNQGIAVSPGVGGASNVLVDDNALSNNSGIHAVAVNMWYAFKLPTGDRINIAQVRNGDQFNYAPAAIIVESSPDGATWTFEFGQTQLVWGGNEIKTFTRPNIDWGTYTNRDWLVRAFKVNGNTNLGITEMEMADSPGAIDQCEGGLPRSTNNSSYPAANLTDNDVNSLCGSTGYGRQAWVGYTFAAPVKVDEVRFNCHGNEQPQCTALAVNLGTQGDFGGPWEIKQIVEGVPPLGWGPWHSLDFRRGRPAGATAPHRYWRARATSPSTGNEFTLFSASRIEWRDKAGTLISTGGTPIGENQYDGNNSIAMAYDEDGATHWASAFTGAHTHIWIGYDFGAPVFPGSFSMRSTEATGYWNRSMKNFNIEWSDDAAMWYPHEGYISTYTGEGQTQTFFL